MKFTIHNLRMIKARFSSNGWVLAELFLVFIVMWFLCDSLGCMKYTFYRPLGYNINTSLNFMLHQQRIQIFHSLSHDLIACSGYSRTRQ